MDRVVIATAAPVIEKEYGFSPVTIGWIFASFSIAYALFQIPGGWLGVWFGPLRALPGAVLWWSTFTAAQPPSWSAVSLMLFRFLFGLGAALERASCREKGVSVRVSPGFGCFLKK